MLAISHDPIMQRCVDSRWISVLVITTLGAALRFYCILFAEQDLQLDESYSVYANSLPIREGWNFISNDTHPPLYWLILKAWTYWFGDSLTILRMPSVLFGLMTVPMVYYLANSLFNRRAAFFAMLLTAISPVLIYYSNEIRSYSLLILMVTLSTILFVATINGNAK
jgi:uncharacterized membrane protein